MHFRSRILCCALALLTCTSLFAAEFGSVSGRVVGSDGAPLPGVLVSISGPYLPAGRNMTTESDGAFAFQRLLPGPYDVTAELAGLGTAKRRVVVEVDKDTQATLTLTQSISEEITVSAAAPVVDVKSTEIADNFTRDVIEDLPITRSYTGLFQLAPGVADNGRASFVAGGSFQDNTYLADGINITNPFFGNNVPNISELDIQEVNIKRGGVSAEFGATFGMVVNAVTKSGTNEIRGEGRFEYQPADLSADPEQAAVPSAITGTTDKNTAALSIGGPIFRDRLWYYGSVNFPRFTTSDRVNQLGALPSADDNTDEYFIKLTANPASAHFLNASYRLRDSEQTNQGFTSVSALTRGRTDETRFQLLTGGWIWNLTPSSFIDLKGNFTDQDGELTVNVDAGHRPLPFDVNHPELMGAFTIPAGRPGAGNQVGPYTDRVNAQDYFRREARTTFQTLQNWLGWSHDLRTGFSYDDGGENLSRLSNGWGDIILTTSGGRPAYRARHYTAQPEHRSHVETWGVYAQDQLSIGQRTTVNAGLLVNTQEAFGGDGARVIKFDWDQMIQPRLGVSWVPSLAAHDKVYVNYGRYTNLENLSIARAGSQTRLFRTDAFFDAATGALISQAPQSASRPKRIVQGIDPMSTDEWIAGYERPINNIWSAEIWGMYRQVKNFVEDMPNDLVGNGQPGFKIDQLPGAKRNYEAVTLEVNHSGSTGRWMGLTMNASYTWSKLYGNWDVDFVGPTAGQFYNSSFLQDGPGLNVEGDNRLGILQGDRTHVAKIFATIHPLQRLSVGGYLRWQSGQPWEARGLETANSGAYYHYLEPAGSRRTDDWLNLDVLGSYDFSLGGFGDLEIEARMINVFDEQVGLTIDDRVINEATFRATGDPGNATFGKPTTLSSPRTIILSAIVRF